MLTPRQFAKKFSCPYTTVMTWLQLNRIKGAKKRTTPTGHYYEIPENAQPPVLKRGRPKESDGTNLQK